MEDSHRLEYKKTKSNNKRLQTKGLFSNIRKKNSLQLFMKHPQTQRNMQNVKKKKKFIYKKLKNSAHPAAI